MPKLHRKTNRLTLRPLKIEDHKAWITANTTRLPQKNIWDQKNKPPSELTLAKFNALMKIQKSQREKELFFDFAIFKNSTGQLIGKVSLMEISRGVSHSACLGYFLENSVWGQGYAKEAVLAGIKIAFKDLKLHRVEAGIEPSNRRSLFLARAIGLRKEGLRKRAIYLRNKWLDLVIYSATCEDFEIRWSAPAKAAAKPRRRR